MQFLTKIDLVFLAWLRRNTTGRMYAGRRRALGLSTMQRNEIWHQAYANVSAVSA